MYLVFHYSLHNINRLLKPVSLGGPWYSGAKLPYEVPDPLEFTVDKDSVGTQMRAYYGSGYPLMRDDLIAALKESGVDNLDLYNAVITNPMDGKVYHNYKAVNILGIIACADMEMSELSGTSGDSELFDVDFDSLVIDESKTNGALFFRLAESVNAIIVSEEVADIIEAKEIPGVGFILTENWSG